MTALANAPETTVTTTNPADLTVSEASDLLATGELSSVELVDACLARIAERDGERSFLGDVGSINAWVRTYDDDARSVARTSDVRRTVARHRGGAAGPLDGIPLGLKDIYAVAGKPLTASSRVLDIVPEQDCAVWTRLQAAGMVLLGHTHTHEFALGGYTDQVGNPWDLTRSPGGSSGGSAAALAANMVPAATGTDTGGSLRIPSSYCGTSTIKPTRTLTSIDGVIPISIHLDHTGPMARTLVDCSMLLAAMAGPTPGRPETALLRTPGFTRLAPRGGSLPLSGLRIAVSPRISDPIVTAEVAKAVTGTIELAVALGATLVEAPTPAFDQEAFWDMMRADAASYHEQHREKASLYRPEVAQILAPYWEKPLPAHRYVQTHETRRAITGTWERWFTESEIDLLVEPTTATTAVERTVGTQTRTATDEAVSLTAFWNWTGFPVSAFPAGLGVQSGLPVGVSLVGRPGDDLLALQTGIDLQERLGVPTPKGIG
jgi:aspartyl-tRNA(Asn)/glutamyl-tRNA(Gln) amidotransferase subunit A